jgi:hypothetical protein
VKTALLAAALLISGCAAPPPEPAACTPVAPRMAGDAPPLPAPPTPHGRVSYLGGGQDDTTGSLIQIMMFSLSLFREIAGR